MYIKQKSLQTGYVYKTKQNKMLRDKLCLQNKQMFTNKSFTNTMYLQNKNKIKSVQTSYVYKTKVNKHIMFTKQKITNKFCLQNKTKANTRYVYETKQYNTESLQTRYIYKTKLLHTSDVYHQKN